MSPAAADITPEDLQKDLAAASEEVDAAAETPLQGAVSSEVWKKSSEPVYGGTLNATSETAAEDARRLADGDRNKTILSHGGGYIADQAPPAFTAPINAASQPPEDQTMVNPLSGPGSPTLTAAPVEPLAPTLAELDQQNRTPAVPGLPPLPDFSTLPPLPPPPPIDMTNAAPPTEKLGDILPPAAPASATASDPGQFRIPGQS